MTYNHVGSGGILASGHGSLLFTNTSSGGVQAGGYVGINYRYTSTGQVRVGGCSNYRWIIFYHYAYAIGSTVYYKKKALKGVFEKVVIKDVRLPKSYDPSRVPICRYCNSTLYIDTLNAYFNEEELIPYEEALALVLEYDLRRRKELEWLAFNCQ